jgi:preprotein translocase subunit SecD
MNWRGTARMVVCCLLALSFACAETKPDAPSLSAPRDHAAVEFAIVADAKTPAPSGSRTVEYKGRDVTLEPGPRFDIQKAHTSQDNMGWPAIAFEIADAQAAEFERWTGDNVHRGLAVLIDGKVVMIATIQDPLTKGGIISSGDEHWSEEQARELAARIAPAR